MVAYVFILPTTKSAAPASSLKLLTFNTLLHNGAYLGGDVAVTVPQGWGFGIQPDGPRDAVARQRPMN